MQPSLLDIAPPFAGPPDTIDLVLDDSRLRSLQGRVTTLMVEDGVWRTLAEIKAITGGSEAGISARLRAARRPEFGGYTVARRRRGDPAAGLWEYRISR